MTEEYLLDVIRKNKKNDSYYSALTDAVEYSLMAGGKRIRPVMLLAACEMAGGTPDHALPFAAAIEMIHSSSLIHDDLPAMDDDDLRRGKPTNHKVFGEATAILAGDALLVLPFEIMAAAAVTAKDVSAMLILAKHAGIHGMFGGQQIDLAYEGKQADEKVIVQLNRLKTGALFRAAVCAGIAVGSGTEEQILAGDQYGENIGLAFQLVDDLLDNDPNANTGKTKGSDLKQNKSTYLSVYGEKKSRQLIQTCTAQAEQALRKTFGEKADFLVALAGQLQSRNQ